MKKYIILSVIFTFFCIAGNLFGLTNSTKPIIDRNKIGLVGNHLTTFLQKHDTIRPDSNIFIHNKSNEYELWMYKNNIFKVIYSDGKYIIGTWKFEINKYARIEFFKNDELSTSEKDFHYQYLEYYDVFPNFHTVITDDEYIEPPDPYPLLWDGNK